MTVLAWPAFENKTGNPYTGLLYDAVEALGVSVEDFSGRRALEGGYDLWHLHWPDDFLSYAAPWTATVYVAAELLLMAQARARGTRIVWTIHDLGPHESPHPWLERLFWPLFLPMIDGYITLSEHARTAAQRRFPALRAVPGRVVPHGHYRPAYPDPPPKTHARQEWDLPPDDPVLVYVGRIRPYKNVERLVASFRQLESDRARLVVAGNPSTEALAERIRAAAGADPRVQRALRFLPEAEMASVLAAADLVVLPYEDILHSGTALLALSFDRPVLVPAEGAMSELQEQVGAEWVYIFDGALRPDTLRKALHAAKSDRRADRAPLDDLSWPPLAEDTVALYEEVLAGDAAGAPRPHRS
ncbi:MAG: glycosyltransferase family 4 protein [Salinibacter sp.]